MQHARSAGAAARGRRRGTQRATLADVAALAGVSAMTVSRTLTGGVPVSAATRKQVERAVKALDYRPNTAARQLAGGAPYRVGFIYANPSQAYLSELLVGMLEEAQKQGLQIALTRVASRAARGREIAAMLRSGVAAFLLPPSLCDAADVLELLARAGARWAAITPADAAIHPFSVAVDDAAAAARMTQWLIELGHRRIGFIRGDPAYRAADARHAGFLRQLSSAGLQPGATAQGRFSFQSGLEAAEIILAKKPRCTAIFASNDDMAAAAIVVARRLGLAVPGDLSVVGFDDTPICGTVSPTITTMRQPIAGMAKTAVRLLARAIAGRAQGTPAEAHKLFPCALVARESAGPPRLS